MTKKKRLPMRNGCRRGLCENFNRFSTRGATEHDVALMRSVVGDKLGVKASGGVRTPEDAEKFIAAGATRLGTSNGVKLLG